MSDVTDNNELVMTGEEQTAEETGKLCPEFSPFVPKPLFNLEKGDTAFALCALAASVFTSVFGLFGGFSLGYLLSVVLMMALFTVYFGKRASAGGFAVVSGLLAAANGAVFICTSNGSVRFFAVLISFLSALVFFDGLVNGKVKGNRQQLVVFLTAASTAANVEVSVKSLLANDNGEKRTVGKALVGLICAFPVLVIVVPLLISSDDAFRGMVNNLFSNTFSTLIKAFLGIILALFVISYGFSLKKGRVSEIKERKFSGVEGVYAVSFLSAISGCYLLYLFSQLAYFFSAFSGFLPDGQITYAQYARKGFFEMCVIAVINLVIVFAALLLTKKKEGKVCGGVRALATFIAGFTLIIIATAISKMVLYIEAYGMTVLRITTSAFMLFLAVVFVSAILRIYIEGVNIVKTALVTAGSIVLLLGVINVNAVCARYNYESYVSGRLEMMDVYALYSLGDEGIPYVVKLADDEDPNIAFEAKKYLADAYFYDYFEDMQDAEELTVEDLRKQRKDKGFARFSLPKAKAYESFYEYIEENPDFAAEYREPLYEQSEEYYWE